MTGAFAQERGLGYEGRVRGLVHLVVRAVCALLLALAVISPAVAEIGCSAEAAVHADAGAGEEEHRGEPEPGSDADGHCAFSHGHCGGVAPVAAGAPLMPDLADGFMAAAPPGFVSTRLSGPHRPPRA